MTKIKTIGQWKYFLLSYLLIATPLIIYFIPDAPTFIIWGMILIPLSYILIVARNPIIKIDDQNIRLIYLFSEKNIPRKNIVKINSFPILGGHILVTKNDKFFIILNPFMSFMNSWTSTQSYSDKITTLLKGDAHS